MSEPTAVPDFHAAARADLRERVADLAHARGHAQRLAATLDFERFTFQQAFDATHATLIADEAEARKRLLATDQSLRGLAIAFGEATGEKNPAPGLEMIQQVKLIYEDGAALEWAVKTGIGIQLARKEFERVAKSTALPFVTTTRTLAVRIASDLDAALTPEAQP